MKILITTFLFLVIAASSNAQILFTENFNYAPGEALTSHGWTSFGGDVTNPVQTVTPGQIFPGYILSNIGYAAGTNFSGQDVYKEIPSAVSGSSVYFSLMVMLDTVRGEDCFLGLLKPGSTTDYAAKLYVKPGIDNGGVVGISKGNSSVIHYGGLYINRGFSVFIVIKYTFGPQASDDVITAYSFMSEFPLAEPSEAKIGPFTDNSVPDADNIGRVAIIQGSPSISSKFKKIDGLLLSRVWGNLTTGLINPTTIPEKFSLSQNFPNPFNPNTKINFELKTSAEISLNIYNTNGQLIKILENGFKKAGSYEINFSAEALSSGVYYYSLYADGVLMDTKKAIVLK
jgi:hypothetical protein